MMFVSLAVMLLLLLLFSSLLQHDDVVLQMYDVYLVDDPVIFDIPFVYIILDHPVERVDGKRHRYQDLVMLVEIP